MVMPALTHTPIPAASGAETQGGRRPEGVLAPEAAWPELKARQRRRTFSARDKLRILAELDGADTPGATGAILRREGLYSSAITGWRRQRAAGTYAALTPVKRGPKPEPVHPLNARLAQAEQENRKLKQRLERAEAIIEIQKNQRGLMPPVGVETLLRYLACGRERPSTFWWHVTP